MEHLPVVLERSLRFIGSGTTDAAIPLASPNGHGIVEYVFITYLVDVRCPQTAVRLKIRSGTVGKGSTYIFPIHQIPGTVNRQITYVLGGIQIVVAVTALYHRRVGQTVVYHRIAIDILRLFIRLFTRFVFLCGR